MASLLGELLHPERLAKTSPLARLLLLATATLCVVISVVASVYAAQVMRQQARVGAAKADHAEVELAAATATISQQERDRAAAADDVGRDVQTLFMPAWAAFLAGDYLAADGRATDILHRRANHVGALTVRCRVAVWDGRLLDARRYGETAIMALQRDAGVRADVQSELFWAMCDVESADADRKRRAFDKVGATAKYRTALDWLGRAEAANPGHDGMAARRRQLTAELD